MSPLQHFEAVWQRAAILTALHAYISANVVAVVQTDELLRAEWMTRVAALDLYVHELVAQRMIDIFENRRIATPQYLKFVISNDTVERIRKAVSSTDAAAAFDLDVREQLSIVSYQDPEKIADGVRLISLVELWNEVALHLGATLQTKNVQAKALKKQLSLIVRRRNKIVHEGDLQPTIAREPWPINQGDLLYVSETLERIVHAIDAVVK